MKKLTEKRICCIPLAIWIIIIPLVVKMKSFANPLLEYPWYSREEIITDFFLYHKSMLVTFTGILMLLLLFWQVSKVRNKDALLHKDTRIFIPILVYLVLAVLSSLFSSQGYFCVHGMPDQFETIWNLIAYVVAVIYCYYVVAYQDCEMSIVRFVYAGAGLVGIICVLQYFKVDIYRMIYKGASFTWEVGTVYGSFYNINYVGVYVLLFLPLFLLFLVLCKDLKVRLISAVMSAFMLISIIGARSSTSEIALVLVVAFLILFLLIKNAIKKKALWVPAIALIVAGICACIVMLPRVRAYIQASDTEKTDLEKIFTCDDHVEVYYKGNQLNIKMQGEGAAFSFELSDQNQAEVVSEYTLSEEDGYYYFAITDNRFSEMKLTPIQLSEEPLTMGFMVTIEEKNWIFTNQMTEDNTYYYYSDLGTLAKLTEETASADFEPLVDKSGLASGRGYIWNKTIAILKKYVLFGSGADTFLFEFPNDDFVDLYNNGYMNMFISKPHNLYLQIAVQTGVLSLICFLVFYLWYFISSVRIYLKQRLDNPLVITGFAIMLGTLGYMISGIANDSTVTVAPLYWALMGVGIGINYRIKSAVEK